MTGGVKTLADSPVGASVVVASVGGERPFRRRLLEMGLIPGVAVRVRAVAPLGDPIEIELRYGRISIRKFEARLVEVEA